MRILLFGPMELVANNGAALRIGGERRRAVLATLALNANRVVLTRHLLEAVWGHQAPPSARAVLQGHIARLRRLLDGSLNIVTREYGYQLNARPDAVDLLHLRDLARYAESAKPAKAEQALFAALDLRRGPALVDCGSHLLQDEDAVEWEDAWLRILEQATALLLDRGEGPRMTARLADAVRRNPLYESLARLLMFCLAQEHRQAAALEVYHAIRSRLASELGVDPGRQLQDALEHVLRGTAIDGAAPLPAVRRFPAAGESYGLSAACPLVGRSTEAAVLTGAAGRADVLLVTGGAGVGKSALARTWCETRAHALPGGLLRVGLRGFDEREPMTADEVLAALLRAFGVAQDRLPATESQRQHLYRRLLAERRPLLLLDDAASSHQVLHVLPHEGQGLAVVTSRSTLPTLAAGPRVSSLPLGPLAPDDGWELFSTLSGRNCQEAGDDAARIVAVCDGLPLGLAVAARWAATHPTWPVGAFAEHLADESTRLDVMSPPGAPGVRQALHRTVASLDAPDDHTFRLLGLLPSTAVGTFTMADLSGDEPTAVRMALARLATVHLVREQAPDRYVMDGLTWLYAREQAETLSGHERAQARRELTVSYLNATNAAVVTLYFEEGQLAPEPSERGRIFISVSDVRHWFSQERCTIKAMLGAPAHGLTGALGRLAANYRLLDRTEPD